MSYNTSTYSVPARREVKFFLIFLELKNSCLTINTSAIPTTLQFCDDINRFVSKNIVEA